MTMNKTPQASISAARVAALLKRTPSICEVLAAHLHKQGIGQAEWHALCSNPELAKIHTGMTTNIFNALRDHEKGLINLDDIAERFTVNEVKP